MAKINLEFDADNKLQAKADSDDFTDSYMLGRQVAHEYYSSAVQSFITAESAARQVELEAQKDEVDRFREDKSKKQTEGKAAEKVFADTMVETMQRRQGGTEGKGSGKVAPEGGGGGWGEEDAPKSMPGAESTVKGELSGLEEPMVDPTMAGAAGAAGVGKMAMASGVGLIKSLPRALAAGVVSAATDYPIGAGADAVGAVNPVLALPFALTVGLLSGAGIEPIIERGILKAAAVAGKKLTPDEIGKQVKFMRGVLANEAGEVGAKVDDLTKAAVIEEINKEVGSGSLKDALRTLKGESGQWTIKEGESAEDAGKALAPVKGGSKKSGIPVAEGDKAVVGPERPGMVKGAQDFLANKNPDITKETAGNIRLWGADLEPKFMGDLETPEDIMRVISGTHEAFAKEQEAARRGVRSWEETAAEAKNYRLEDLLGRRIGQALNAEQIDNARTLLVSSSDTLRGMATLIRSGQANDLQKADFMRAFNVHYAIQMQLSGAAAEAGRALQIFRKVAQADDLKVAQLKEFLTSTADKKITPESLAEAISGMETPAQVAAFVKQAKRATTWDMFVEAWINGLLSGPVTHAVNSLSNALTAMWMIPERALAAGISSLHGGEIRGGEVASQAFGLVQGAKDGFKAAWTTLKTGAGADAISKIEQDKYRAITAENVRQIPAIKKIAPNALEEGGVAARFVDALGEWGLGPFSRLPGRFLQAEDDFFKAIGYRMELNAQAFRKASQEGLEGEPMARRIQEILADPENLAPEVHLAAVKASNYQTFTNSLGGAGQAVQSFANKMPGAKLIIPFVRTPANIMKFALERNLITAPFFKQVRADILAGGARMDTALAKISMGSMAMAVVGTYAASGMITGGGPEDKDLRSHMYNTGWQPYSIKIGDKYYSYGRLEPIGMMMGLAADAVEIMGELDEAEGDKIATTIVAAIGKNVMSKTWLRGMSEMIHAMDDPGRYGPNYIKQFAGTAVPTGVAQIERTMYPELSDARTALDAIKSRIPGYSNDIPTRRNLWGEKITFNGALGPDIISPILTSSKKDSKIDKELIRMEAPLRMPQRTQSFEGVPYKLDAAEYEEFLVRMNNVEIESTGMNLKKSLDNLVSKDADYKSLNNDDHKYRMIKGYMQEAIEKARQEMIDQNYGIRQLVDYEHSKAELNQ